MSTKVSVISRGKGKKNLRGRDTAQIVVKKDGHSRTYHCEDLGRDCFRTLNDGKLQR